MIYQLIRIHLFAGDRHVSQAAACNEPTDHIDHTASNGNGAQVSSRLSTSVQWFKCYSFFEISPANNLQSYWQGKQA
jgi:hypothetical protein